jgi:hypothetical protein
MASRQPAPTGRRSWRESPARTAAAPTRGSKTPLRVLLTLVVAALLAGFVWLVWQPVLPEPPTHFVALLTGESDMLSMPPILFEQETVKPLRDLADESEIFKFDGTTDAQSAGQLADIQARIDKLGVGEGDRLIVYVSAHGVSEGDQAYVLAADYNLQKDGIPPRNSSRKLRISKLRRRWWCSTARGWQFTRGWVWRRTSLPSSSKTRLSARRRRTWRSS